MTACYRRNGRVRCDNPHIEHFFSLYKRTRRTLPRLPREARRLRSRRGWWRWRRAGHYPCSCSAPLLHVGHARGGIWLLGHAPPAGFGSDGRAGVFGCGDQGAGHSAHTSRHTSWHHTGRHPWGRFDCEAVELDEKSVIRRGQRDEKRTSSIHGGLYSLPPPYALCLAFVDIRSAISLHNGV